MCRALYTLLFIVPLLLNAQKVERPIVLVDFDFSQMTVNGEIEAEFLNREKEKFSNEKKWRWDEWLERWEANKNHIWKYWLFTGLENQNYQLKPKFVTKDSHLKKGEQTDFTVHITPKQVEWVHPSDTFPPVLLKADVLIKDETGALLDTFIVIDSFFVQMGIEQAVKTEKAVAAGMLFGVVGVAVAYAATGDKGGNREAAPMVPYTEEDLLADNYYLAGRKIGEFSMIVMVVYRKY